MFGAGALNLGVVCLCFSILKADRDEAFISLLQPWHIGPKHAEKVN